jgi:hypothetical protein
LDEDRVSKIIAMVNSDGPTIYLKDTHPERTENIDRHQSYQILIYKSILAFD